MTQLPPATLDDYIDAFLTAWYPGEWPDDLPPGEINGETFATRARRETLAAFTASGLTPLIRASLARTHYHEKLTEDRQNGRLPR